MGPAAELRLFALLERCMKVVAAGTVMELVPVPSGEFLMGSGNQLFSVAPSHWVRFRSGFLLGKYPVTQGQWQAVMGNNPSTFRESPDHPVDSVSSDQSTEYTSGLLPVSVGIKRPVLA